MVKFRLPEGATTAKLTYKFDDGDYVILKFNDKGEATCASKYADEIQKRTPALVRVEEPKEPKKAKKSEPKPELETE